MSTSKPHNRVDGVYYNTSPDPVFVEDALIGGHEYTYIEGYIRIPGQFIAIDDPREDDDAPSSFKRAYAKMLKTADENAKEVHANSANSKSNVIPVEQPIEEARKPSRKTSTKSPRESNEGDSKDQ